jgi:3-methyl-2-oxobutanoate hydroxymethyltransferase
MSTQPSQAAEPRVTATALRAMKQASRPIVMVTAYDHPGARLVEQAGVDAVLVGDSLGMTVLGFDSTLPVTMEDMVRHTAAVSRACTRVLVVADMPFMSYQASKQDGMRNAGRLIAEAGAHAVKLEGATESTLELTRALVDAGIPVLGHLGLTPQSVNSLGGYSVQAREADSAALLLRQCVQLEAAGAFGIVLECIPAELAERASALVSVPTIGIGAGVGCDGQVQVFHDLLGLSGFTPRHAAVYAEIGAAIRAAVESYTSDVRDRSFPGEPQVTHLDTAVLAQAELLYAGEERHR